MLHPPVIPLLMILATIAPSFAEDAAKRLTFGRVRYKEAWNNYVVPTFRSLEDLGRRSLRLRC